MIVFALVAIGLVLFFVFIHVGLLPLDCSPHRAIAVAGIPSARGAWGLWACHGTTSIVFGLVVPGALVALAPYVGLAPSHSTRLLRALHLCD